jgi:uncharacterized LabA/DUF88 family protein
MVKAAVFIDGGYFRRVLKDVFDEPIIDYSGFCDRICGGAERIRTYYYDCTPLLPDSPTEEERRRYNAMQKFLHYLQMCRRISIRLGHLRKTGVDSKPRQEGIDLMMSVELVRMSWDHQIDQAILVTGDNDFVHAVKAAKDAGVVTKVYYSRGAPTVYAHDELLRECDEKIEITEELIESVRKQPILEEIPKRKEE